MNNIADDLFEAFIALAKKQGGKITTEDLISMKQMYATQTNGGTN